MSSDPSQPPITRDETINDREPRFANPMTDSHVLTTVTNVDPTTAAEDSAEGVGEEEAYISVTDAEYT